MTQPHEKKTVKRKRKPVEGIKKKKNASLKTKKTVARGRKRSENTKKAPIKKHRMTPVKRKRKKKPGKQGVRRKKQSPKIILIEIGITVFIFLLVVFVLSKVTFTTIKLEGYSMTEQLNDGDRLFINRMKSPSSFDLIAFKDSKGDVLVRRVIGVPGDRLYYKDDQLYVNEEEKLERYLENAVSLARQGGMKATEDFTLTQLTGENSVPENNYFVLGDNRQYATDSRHFGFVDKKAIIGVVEFRFFPFHTLAGF